MLFLIEWKWMLITRNIFGIEREREMTNGNVFLSSANRLNDIPSFFFIPQLSFTIPSEKIYFPQERRRRKSTSNSTSKRTNTKLFHSHRFNITGCKENLLSWIRSLKWVGWRFRCCLSHWCTMMLLIECVFICKNFVILFGEKIWMLRIVERFRRARCWRTIRLGSFTYDCCCCWWANIIIRFITGIMTRWIRSFQSSFLVKKTKQNKKLISFVENLDFSCDTCAKLSLVSAFMLELTNSFIEHRLSYIIEM